MLRPQASGFKGEERPPRNRKGALPVGGPSLKARGDPVWGTCKAAECCKHQEAEGQLGGSALIPGTSFFQRKTPAVTGVAKRDDNCKEQSRVSRPEDRKLGRVSGWAPSIPSPPGLWHLADPRAHPQVTVKIHFLRTGLGTGDH